MSVGTGPHGHAPTAHWLPVVADWRQRLRDLRAAGPREKGADSASDWPAWVALADARLDFAQTAALDAACRQRFPAPPAGLDPLRLAVLGSSTLAHLLPGLRVAALRRGLWLDARVADYGQYRLAIEDPGSTLAAFSPQVVLLAFDARHLTRGITAAADAAAARALLDQALEELAGLWRSARDRFGCTILQQTILPCLPPLLGSNEHRLAGSPAAAVTWLNQALREKAEAARIHLVALDARAATDGLAAWHDPALWHRAKQEVSPAAAPAYGELVGRLLGARQGRSRKCLVLDLDNTLWGGVVGDDGAEGLVLGQGSAEGEAFQAVQALALALTRRGIILAVSSKNDEAVALAIFDRHPEMLLRREHVACFAVNWQNKPDNLRGIAAALGIGLDSLVFLDDNPVERDLVRRELPMVAVPELAEDPAHWPRALADAGYFEALDITDEDRGRTALYGGNRAREALRETTTDLGAYLRSLGMRLICRAFDRVGLQRSVQLIARTNQFNLTTRRYGEEEVLAVMADPAACGLQLRLIDRFGDNGVVAVVIGRLQADRRLLIDTWLMSCRVLGRRMEEATLNLLVAEARRLGATALLGEYRPSPRNGMVRDLLPRLGFVPLAKPGFVSPAQPGSAPPDVERYLLELAGFAPLDTPIAIEEA